MADQIAPLRLGTKVCFEDRWQGRITAIDASEDWDVLNITVSSGLLFAARSVKLPFSSVTRWTEDAVYIGLISFKAFAREVPPVATPSRPLTSETPISHPGMKFAGLLVSTLGRRATEVLLSRGMGRMYRVPVASVVFEGKTLTLGQQAEGLPEYYPDDDLLDELRAAIAGDDWLTPDDKRSLIVEVDNGRVKVAGNVRVKQTRERIDGIIARVRGAVAYSNEITDDLTLETEIGQALDRAGLTREAQVYARSNLGHVVLYGEVPNPALSDDIARTVLKLRGVRQVDNRLNVGRQPRPTTGGPVTAPR